MSEYPTVDWDVADVVKRCATCHQTFTEERNIGRWECRMHPGMLENGVFLCCGQRTIAYNREDFLRRTTQPGLLGCRACDHRAVLDLFSGQEKCQFPARFLGYLGSRREAIVRIITPAQIGVDKMLVCSRIEGD